MMISIVTLFAGAIGFFVGAMVGTSARVSMTETPRVIELTRAVVHQPARKCKRHERASRVRNAYLAHRR